MVVSRGWSARREGWTPQSEDARDDGESDFYRTRLSHSLEVAQIAGGIARQLEKSYPGHPATPLLPDRGTIHSIGCTNDFGHLPATLRNARQEMR